MVNSTPVTRPHYGEVIKRTGTGEVPEPTTGFAPVGVLQPAMLSTVIAMSPRWAGRPPPWTSSMNACKKPTTLSGAARRETSRREVRIDDWNGHD
jgi:hypothetical protein